MTVRHRWRSVANPGDLAGRLRIGRASTALGRRRQDWLAIGAAVGNASSRRLTAAGKSLGLAARAARSRRAVRRSRGTVTTSDQPQLSRGQRRTLETGSVIVLSGLGLGVQFGSWPAWTILAGVGMYLGWAVLYAEITVQQKRRPALFQRWRWHGRPRSRGRPRPSSAWIKRQVSSALARVDSVDRARLRARFVGWRAGRHPGDGAASRVSPSPMSDPGQPTAGRTPGLEAGECTTALLHELPIGAHKAKP
jgi:hypothetical protein